jgi:hypothetical protein
MNTDHMKMGKCAKSGMRKLGQWVVGVGGGLLLMCQGLQGQNLLSSDFFDAELLARRAPGQTPGGTIGLDLGIFNGLIGVNASTDLLVDALATSAQTDNSGGNVSWQHAAKGLVYANFSLSFPLSGSINVDLFAQTYTTAGGNSLVFGRDLNIPTSGSVFEAVTNVVPVENLVNSVLGASVINAWSSTATVTFDAPLTAGQLYSISFSIDSGPGLNADAFGAASFGISSGDTDIMQYGGGQLLNLLDLLTVGNTLTDGVAEFLFVAPSDLTSLNLTFSAATLEDVNLLGGAEGNQNVFTFSNISMTPVAVPEPGSVVMVSLGLLLIFRRRR